jgi:RecB family exonuclease
VIDLASKVYVSPSSLDPFDECSLKWFLEKSGARDGDGVAQLLGVAIHYIAAQHARNPQFDLAAGIDELVTAWPMVDQSIGWYKEVQLDRAKEMLTRFFEWSGKNPREVVSAEERFKVEFGRVVLSGSVDRLEIDPGTGRYFIVDLKTGAPISSDDAKANLQLAAYQLGVVEGGFESIGGVGEVDGAGLLYLSKSTKKNETIDQGAVVRDEFMAKVQESAEAMSSNTFTATINSRCRTCQVKVLCPLQSQGRSVLDER